METHVRPALCWLRVPPREDQRHPARVNAAAAKRRLRTRFYTFPERDNVYSYENIEGIRGNGVLAPIAMSTGSATAWLDLADTMLTSVDGDSRRILPFHEAAVWDRFPTTTFDDGLHVAEVSLAGGHPSVLSGGRIG